MSIAAIPIDVPVPINTSAIIEIEAKTNRRLTVADSLVGDTVTALVRNPNGGSTYSYPVTIDSGTAGTGRFTITGSNHLTVGDAAVQLYQNGELRARYKLTFVEKLVAS